MFYDGSIKLLGINSSLRVPSYIDLREKSSGLKKLFSINSSSDDESFDEFIHFELKIALIVGLFLGLGFRMAVIRFLACLDTFLAGLPKT